MDMDIEMPFEPSSFITKKSDDLDEVPETIKGTDPSDKVDDEVSSEKSNDEVPFEKAGAEVDKFDDEESQGDDETDIEDDDDIDAEVPASKVGERIPTETGTSDDTDENYVDKDVVMKERDITPVDNILKCDTASNSDSVLAPKKRSVLSPQKLDFKPLASLLLEAIQTPKSPKSIEDPLTESM